MKKGVQEGNVLPLWAGEDPGSGSVCDLLHPEATG